MYRITYRLNKDFDRTLERIGISHEDRLKRNLSFHAWRHFLNTLLRMYGVADSKVSSVTGHLSKKMIEHYTHFDTRKFTEVRDVQTELLTAKKPEKAKKKQGKATAAEKTESVAQATA